MSIDMFYISTMNILQTPYSVYNKFYTPLKTQSVTSFKGYSSFSMDEEEETPLYTIPVELWRSAYGFRMPKSEEMEQYRGKTGVDAGFSTEAGGYGGGYIINNIDVPLSTKDMHGCALLNLVNTKTNEQLLYHVFDQTGGGVIEEFIKEKFPRFDKVNIMPGDQWQTQVTMNKILTAVDNINPQAEKTFYHSNVENPEVVSVGGKLYYIENDCPNKMSFKETDNYVM